AGEPALAELLQDLEVRRDGGLGLLDVGGVLAQVVQAGPDAVLGQPGRGLDAVARRLARHVPADDAGRDRHPPDQVLDPRALGEGRERAAQEGHAVRLRAGPWTGSRRTPASWYDARRTPRGVRRPSGPPEGLPRADVADPRPVAGSQA